MPVWSARYVPTADGPCHVYNAWVLLHLDDPALPHLAETFEVRREPLPNWSIQALLVALLTVAPPLVAEKLLLTLYVVAFAAAGWYFAASVDRSRAANAFLLLPFAWHELVYWGFYNFAFGVPLLLVAVGYWWRHRDAPSPRFALAVNALLLLCYFTHLVALVMALVAIAVLWAASWPGRPLRRHALHVAILAPQALLPLWFLTSRGTDVIDSGIAAPVRLAFLARLGVLFPFQPPAAGVALALLFAALAAATLIGRRRPAAVAAPSLERPAGAADGPPPATAGPLERHAFALVALAFTAVFLLSPEGVAKGTILPLRLTLFPYLALVPWLAPPRQRLLRAALPVGLAVVVAWQAATLSAVHRRLEPAMRAFVAGLAPVERESRLLTIVYRRDGDLADRAFGHLSGWTAIDEALVDWDDYQAATALFPVRFADGLGRPDVIAVEADPDAYRVARHAATVDYVYVWRMPERSPLRRRLQRFYEEAGRSGEGVLYRRRTGGSDRAAR